jgi:prepilin peptidase CpaA
MSLSVVILPATVASAGVLVATATDLWKFKVYNLLTLPLFASGVIYHAWIDGWAGLGVSLLGSMFGFFVLLVFYLMGGMGAGDIKLMAAVGAWLGAPLTFVVFVVSSIAAGIYALGLMVAHRQFRRTWINLGNLWHGSTPANRVALEVTSMERRKNCIPFAAMMAVGLLGVWTLIWILSREAY